MIGDVLKAKKRLGELIGKTELKSLLKYMKDDLSYSTRLVNVDSFVNTVTTECKDCHLGWNATLVDPLSFWNKLEDIIGLLSTRPHTSRSGNFYKYVKGSIGQIEQYASGGLRYPKQAYTNLNRYLTLSKKPKGKPKAEGYKRHENLNDKMGSLREVNRLKILATALSIALINKIYQGRPKAESSKTANKMVQCHIDKSALPYLTKDGELMLKAKGLLPMDWKK